MGSPFKVIVGVLWIILALLITVQLVSSSWLTIIGNSVTEVTDPDTNTTYNDTFLFVLYWVGVILLILVVNILIPMSLIVNGYKGEE